MTFRLVTTVHC